MSTVQCPACDSTISIRATKCPHCHSNLERVKGVNKGWTMAVIQAVFFALCCGFIGVFFNAGSEGLVIGAIIGVLNGLFYGQDVTRVKS